MARRARIADCLKEVMAEEGVDYVWAGQFGMCGEAYSRFGGRVVHPLNRIRAVIDAARRSPEFRQKGYIRAMDSTARREILHPVFELKK